jgi:hypothetical protein
VRGRSSSRRQLFADGACENARHVTRRRLLGLAAAGPAMPLFGPLLSVRANAAAHRHLRFRALRRGSPIGEHRITFRPDGNRLTVD